MSAEIWIEYEQLVAHWRPQFGNDRHIRATEYIAAINRMEPQYRRAKDAYEERASISERRVVPPKRMNALYADLTKLKSQVITLIKV